MLYQVDVVYSDVVSHKATGQWSKLAPLRVLSFDIECMGRKVRCAAHACASQPVAARLEGSTRAIVAAGIGRTWLPTSNTRNPTLNNQRHPPPSGRSWQGHFPEAEVDPVIQISNVVQLQGAKEPIVKNVFTLRGCLPIVGAQIIPSDTEAGLLLKWRDFVVASDPDILTGYAHALATPRSLR